MTSAISQLVDRPNFRAIGQSVWEKNGNKQKHSQKHRPEPTCISKKICVMFYVSCFCEAAGCPTQVHTGSKADTDHAPKSETHLNEM